MSTNGSSDNSVVASSKRHRTDSKDGSESAKNKIANAYKSILEAVGEDASRDGLVRTPQRAAKAFLHFTSGYSQTLADVVGEGIFPRNETSIHVDSMQNGNSSVSSSGIILVRNIDLYSMCEHHMIPFFGKVHIAYIPDKKIIGLSKLARISDMFSRRLQVQERLTEEIADAIMEAVDSRGSAVVIEAEHMCMRMRGVQKTGASTITVCYRGIFEEQSTLRQEFMSLLQQGRLH